MKTLVLAAALLAVGLAGCTGVAQTDSAFVVPPMQDGKYVIEMTASYRFLPANAEVPVGATVLWKNVGGSHNVVAEDGAFTSGAMSTGDFELVITEDLLGEHAYHCEPHKTLGMVGTLRVVPAE